MNADPRDVCRSTGREHFRQRMLSRHGILVIAPKYLQGRPEKRAEYLEEKLVFATGGSLEAYRRPVQLPV